MNWKIRPGVSCALAALLLLLAWLLSFLGGGQGKGWYFDRNNPQRFHLWVTGDSYRYTFTYDPREMDIWMFTSGGGMAGTSVLKPASPESWTNRLQTGPLHNGNLSNPRQPR